MPLDVDELYVNLGGTGGASGNGGGSVKLTNNGAVQTSGAQAHDILQSIGGGGGLVNGAFAELVGTGGFILGSDVEACQGNAKVSVPF